MTPLMRDLLKSPHASYVDLALRFARTVARRFMSLLKSAPEAMEAVRRGGIGVDLVGEERATRAYSCVHALEALRPQLERSIAAAASSRRGRGRCGGCSIR